MLFLFIYFLWFLSEIFLNRFFRSTKSDKKGIDGNSLLLIWITIPATIFIAFFIASKSYFPICSNLAVKYVGLAVILAGMVLRFISIVTLGRYFTVDVTIRQDHRLKKDGLYKHLRHPAYLGSLISFIGLGITTDNWISLLVITSAMLTVFIIRINIEEKALTEQFGKEYTEYRKDSYGLIPFIY